MLQKVTEGDKADKPFKLVNNIDDIECLHILGMLAPDELESLPHCDVGLDCNIAGGHEACRIVLVELEQEDHLLLHIIGKVFPYRLAHIGGCGLDDIHQVVRLHLF